MPVQLSLRSARSFALLAASVAFVAMIALAAHSWLASHDAAVRLASTIAAQKEAIAQIETREQQRDDTLAKTLAAISAAKRAVQTPAAAAAKLPAILPPLPAPVSISIPPPTPAAPAPPAAATIPQADLKPLYDFVQDCHACQAQLSAAQADLSDQRAQVAALTAERNAALKAARGGGLWSRTRRAAKWFLIGAVAGAIAATAARR